VVIPFIESVAEEQRPAVTTFINNSGATTDDLKGFKSVDEFMTGFKPKGQPVDWVSTLPEEQKSLVGIKGWKTPADTIKGYSELEKLVGHEKIAMPQKDNSGNYLPGEFERVMTQLGLPKDPKEYKTSSNFKLPEGFAINPQLEAEFKLRAQKAGVLPSHYAFMMDELSGMLTRGAVAQKEANEKAFNEATLNLRGKWGVTYDERAKLANNVLKNFAPNGKAEEVIKKYGNDPLIIELMAEIGGNLSEESLAKTNMSGTLLSPDAAKAEIAKIRSDRQKELLDAGHPQHDYWIKRLDELYKMI
jgi:hypothetical protein